jgi:hypothetical protein
MSGIHALPARDAHAADRLAEAVSHLSAADQRLAEVIPGSSTACRGCRTRPRSTG